MEQSLEKRELTQIEKDILSVIQTSEISSAKEISNILDIPEKEVIGILNNDEFYNLICANSLSNLRLAYHSKAIPHLIRDLESEHKFYESYDRLTKAISGVKEKDNESMKVSLEVLLKREEKTISAKPISSHSNEEVKHCLNLEKTSGNIFELEETETEIRKGTIEFEFEEEE